MKPDVTVINGGTIFLLRLHTLDAREWVDENVIGEQTMLADGLAVEHRYIADLVEGMTRDGLRLELGY
jgi:hypothetical protein